MGRIKTWSKEETDYLVDNVGMMSLEAIYAHFPNRSKRSVELKVLRLRLKPIKTQNPERVNRNILIEMLKNRIGDPCNFQPKREFFARVQISQKRFWALFRGELNLKEREYLALAQEWNISLEDVFAMRQMELPFEK